MIFSSRMQRIGLALVVTGALACSSFGESEASIAPDAGVVAADAGAGTDAIADAGASSAYAAAVLADKPILYWRLGDHETGTISDSSSGGNVGTPSGPGVDSGPSLLASETDPSIRLTLGASVTAPPKDALAFTGSAPFSVECWVQVTSTQSGTRIVVSRAANPSDILSGYAIYLQGDGKIYFVRRESQNGVNVASQAPISLGVPHHVVGVYTGSALEIHLDGVLQGKSNNAVTVSPHPFAFHIGKDETSAAKLEGIVDEVAVYPFALPSDRIAAHHQIGTTKK